ncbi:EutN/CcmL family microcompartment protein [Nitratireductor sp. XY-223]|uniref:EutN/CcmL family microcompartment protein n=1 Tax=Nitratireductor sp. XY-223 TaxID=2561926 RepID=UPI0010AA4B79|nr:EutN/CcmL family microcompartment protein [Nitratireductor sp. XY-223]
MRIARITGTVTATVKDASLSGTALLLCNVEDGAGAVLEKAVVVADTCGAGAGDLVLLATGSAARLPAKVGGLPVDATVVAIVDHIDIRAGTTRSATSNRRKS